jgi:amidohydrolase
LVAARFDLKEAVMPTKIETIAPVPNTIVDYARRLRHELHQIPELAFEEHLTSKLICRELESMRIPFKAGLAGGTGIAAFISGRRTVQGVVGIRAEMDALPVEEATGAAYISRHPGRMHACGHDGHMAIALGTCRWLWQRRDTLRSGVIVYFQPAEEGFNGGELMRQALEKLGVLPNIVFGLHGWPELPVGTIATRAGVLLAAVDSIEITIQGRGTHGSQPHRGRSPIPCAGYLSTKLQLTPHKAGSSQAVVLSIGCLQAGTAANIIPSTAVLRGTLRTLSEAVRSEKLRWIEQTCRDAARRFGCPVKVKMNSSTPATINDAESTELLLRAGDAHLGRGRVKRLTTPYLWSEDFAYMLQKTQGCFFVLGTCPKGHRSYPMLHSPLYDFPDGALPVGICIMSALAESAGDYLQGAR